MKKFTLAFMVFLLVGCATSPQTLTVAPELVLTPLNGVVVPIELKVTDNRANTDLLGYRNAKQQGPISFSESLAKSIGETVEQALNEQGVETKVGGPEPKTVLEIEIDELKYWSPDESWVSRIEMKAEMSVKVSRGQTHIKKRFASNRMQEVATAPTAEYNQIFLNGMLTELLTKALSDREIVSFIK